MTTSTHPSVWHFDRLKGRWVLTTYYPSLKEASEGAQRLVEAGFRKNQVKVVDVDGVIPVAPPASPR